jgi:signal peptidase I
MNRIRKQSWVALGLLLLFALVLRLNVRQGRVQGPSMSPTYEDGNTVLVWKTFPVSKLLAGNVIVFRDTNGDELIKRVAFIRPVWQPLPPEGMFRTINGGREIPWSLLFGSYFANVSAGKIPQPGKDRTIYVLGDNLLNSDDSRHIGPISPSQVLGKVIP